MRYSNLPHFARLGRGLLLLVLMCALPVNAVLASVGEMHELAHQDYLHAHGGDAHLAPADHAAHGGDTDALESGTGGESGSFLHVLMHASHCCIAQPAIVPSPAMPVPSAAAAGPRRHEDAPPGRHLVSMPFRPPIAM